MIKWLLFRNRLKYEKQGISIKIEPIADMETTLSFTYYIKTYQMNNNDNDINIYIYIYITKQYNKHVSIDVNYIVD